MQTPGRRSRVQLSEYDESLLSDRSIVLSPADGFVSECEEGAPFQEERGGPFSTTWAVAFYTACVIFYVLLQFIDIYNVGDFLSQFRIQASVHFFVLLLAMILEAYLRFKHRRRQQLGYLAFYRHTRALLPIPVQAASLATAALLLIAVWPHQLGRWDQLQAVTAVAVAEAIVVCIFAGLYVVRVWKHNMRDVVPDAQMYLARVASVPDGRTPVSIVEQQQEVIRYLSRQRDNLCREVLRLQTLLDRQWGGAGPEQAAAQEDVGHLLRAREQEVRALLAEKEAVGKEAAATWHLLDEREAEIHRMQVNRQQHMEENARLRATLEEWSHRNAKLEQRLESTRTRLEETQDQLAAAMSQLHSYQYYEMHGEFPPGPVAGQGGDLEEGLGRGAGPAAPQHFSGGATEGGLQQQGSSMGGPVYGQQHQDLLL